MLCEICKKEKATVYCCALHKPAQNLCEGCFERLHPEASARTKELIESGKSSVPGWNSYTPPKLGRVKVMAAPLPAVAGQETVDEVVGDIRRQNFQKFGCAGCRKG
jgi:hypothetical protein